MSRVRKIVIVAIIALQYFGYGQNEKSADAYLPASPTLAGLAKYADTSVGNYSGIPNISIPLYTINSGGVKHPISLSYYAGGIKVADEASWVGLGWSLNAGGMITQQVRGYNDLYPEGFIRSYIYNYGDYDKIHSIGFFNGKNVTYGGSWYGTCGHFPNDAKDWEITYLNKSFDRSLYFYKDMFFIQHVAFESQVQQLSDVEPDLFLYNFGGYTGKFILQLSGNSSPPKAVFLENNNNLNVELIGNSENYSFKVTDPTGVIYVFEITDTSMSDKTNYAEYITGWLLTKIITPNNEEIIFEYELDEQYIKSISSESEVVDYRYGVNSNSPTWFEIDKTRYGLNVHKRYPKRYHSNYSVESNLLKRIVWRGGSVELTSDFRKDYGYGKAKKLSKLEVYNTNNDLIKKIGFEYSYFNNNISTSNSNTYKRLKLTHLKEFNSNSTKNIPYTFGYHEGKSLPAKNGNSYDHWGYSNGKNSSYNSRIPELITFSGVKKSNYNGANRTPDFEYAVSGTLKEITYPSGGKVTYEYELNDFFSTSGAVSGKSSGGSGLIEKTYQYSIRNYMDFAIPFTPKELDTNTGDFSNYEDFEILETANVKSFEIWFDISKEFYDHIFNMRLAPFLLNLYRLEEGSEKEILVKGISLTEFQNAADWQEWEEFEAFRTFKKEYDTALDPGVYRLRFSNFSDDYKNIHEYDTYLTGDLSFKYDGINFKNDKEKSVYGYDAGGLRIKKITSPKNTRTFSYEVGEGEKRKSSGVLLSFPKYRTNSIRWTNQYKIIRFHSDSSIPVHSGVQGNIVGYQNVIETYVSEGGEDFSTHYHYHVERSADPKPNAPLFASALNNKPMYIHKYDSKGKLKEETYYYWEKQIIDKVQAMNIYNKHYILVPDLLYLNTRYFIPIELIKLRYKEKTIYGTTDNTVPIYKSDTHKYTLGDMQHEPLTTHRQISETSTSLENSKVQITKIYRPEEMLTDVPNLSSKQKNIMQDLIDANRVVIPIQTMVYSDEYGNLELLSTSRVEFEKTAHGLILPKRQKTAIGNNPLETTLTYHRYDSSANPLEVSQKDGMHTVYVYGYNKQYPIAQIENATFSEVASALGVSENALENFNETHIGQINGLRAKKPEWMITTYTHIPLVGVKTVTDPRGRRTNYEYDDFNRLKHIKDHNGDILEAYDYHYKTE